MMLIGWGFKDVCTDMPLLWNKKPENCYPKIDSTCHDRSVEERVYYWFYLCGLSIAAVLFNFAFTQLCQLLSKCDVQILVRASL